MNKSLNAYFEHSVISAVARNEEPREAGAGQEIPRLDGQGYLRVWASRVSAKEIERCAFEQTRGGLEDVYRLLSQVPFVETQRLYGFNRLEDRWGTFSVSPMIEDHPWLARVRPLGLGADDEHHLLLALGAEKPKMDVFVTRDRRAFFNDGLGKGRRRKWIEENFGLRIRLPSEFLTELRRSGAHSSL